MEERIGTGGARVDMVSDAWQATSRGANTTGLGEYLERIATLPLLQESATQSLALMQLMSGQRVLDVGCGNGVFLPPLAHAVGPSGRVEGIDHSPQFVAAACERIAAEGLADRAAVQEGDAYALPFPDAAFDAVHCERVLMHLDDPSAAVREMRRVVRPGGWVVAAEPDWAGLRIDHPDHEAMELVLARYVQIAFRQPRIGLMLNRCFAEAGLTERQIVPLVDYFTDHADVARYGYDPTRAAEALIAEGALTRERVEALFAYLEEASRAQSLYGSLGLFVAAGRVPISVIP